MSMLEFGKMQGSNYPAEFETNPLGNEVKVNSNNYEGNEIHFQHFVSPIPSITNALDSRQINPICCSNKIDLKESPFENNQLSLSKMANSHDSEPPIEEPNEENYDSFKHAAFSKKSRGITPTISTYNILIQISVKNKEFTKSYGLLKEMWDAGIMPNISTYNIMLQCYADYDEEGKMRALLKMMHLSWNEDTYNILMKYCEKIKQPAEGLRLFDKLLEAGILPNDKTCEIVTRLDPGMNALGFQKKMCRVAIKSGLEFCKKLMKRYIKNRDLESAMTLFKEIKKSSIQLDAGIYTILLRKNLEKGFMDEFLALWNEMLDTGIEPDLTTYNVVLNFYAKTKDRARGEAIFKTLKKKFEPDVFTYSILVMLREGEGYKALLEEMKSKGIEPNVVTYTTMMQLCKEKGKLAEAKLLWNEMLEKKIKPNEKSYNIMLQVSLEENNLENSSNLWDEMIRRGVKPNHVSYHTMMRLCVNNGDLERALFLKEGMQAHCRPTLETYMILLHGRKMFLTKHL